MKSHFVAAAFFFIVMIISFGCEAVPLEKTGKSSPVKVKPGLKNRDEAEVDRQLRLLSPEDNLVEPDVLDTGDHVNSDTLLPPPAPVVKTFDSPDTFPDADGFITGHRIPLDVLRRRIAADRRYVQASDFRGHDLSQTMEAPTQEPRVPTPERRLSLPLLQSSDIPDTPAAELRPPVPEFRFDTLGGEEGDFAFESTLDKFVPDY